MIYKKQLALFLTIVFGFQGIFVQPVFSAGPRQDTLKVLDNRISNISLEKNIILERIPTTTIPGTNAAQDRSKDIPVDPTTDQKIDPANERKNVPNKSPLVKDDLEEKINYTTILKIASNQGKPSSSSDENQYTQRDGVFINWNDKDLKRWFQWSSSEKNITSVIWQVSVVPFTPDPANWKTPMGLIYQYGINSNQKEFNIDFASFAQTPKEWDQENSKNVTIPYISEVLGANKNSILTNKNKVTFNKILKNSHQISLQKKDWSKEINFSDENKSNASQQVQLNNMANKMPLSKQKTYYIRVVPLDKYGNCLGLPSAPLEVNYGDPYYTNSKTPLKSTDFGRKENEIERYGVLNEIIFNWNTNPPLCYFKTYFPHAVNNAIVQVSSKPFDSSNEADWKTPKNLVHQQNLANLNNNAEGDAYFNINMSTFAPKMYKNAPPFEIPYYARVVFPKDDTDSSNKQKPEFSNTIKIRYGNFVAGSTIQIYEPVKIPVYSPIISVKEYQPPNFRQSTASFHFVVVKEPPSFLVGTYGHVGAKVDLTPHSEDKSFWDQVGDGITSVVGFVGALLNWASATMANLQDMAATLIVSFVPGHPALLKSLIVAGIQAGLVSLGIPPTLPTSDELMNMGVDYIAETVAQGAGIPSSITSEVAKKGVQAMADQAKSSGSIQGSLDFLKLDPDYQYRNAYILIDLYNPDLLNSTLPGSIQFSVKDISPELTDEHALYGSSVYRPLTMPIPALKPRQHLQVPVILNENSEDDYNGQGAIPVTEAWKPYYWKGTSKFNIEYNPALPDVKELANQLEVNSVLIKFEQKYGKPVSFEQRPCKSFIKIVLPSHLYNY